MGYPVMQVGSLNKDCHGNCTKELCLLVAKKKNNPISVSKLQGSTAQFVCNSELSRDYLREAREAFTKKVE